MSENMPMNGDTYPREEEVVLPERRSLATYLVWAGVGVTFVAMYWEVFKTLALNYRLVDSYYSHGFLVPLVSVYLVWRKRAELSRIPITPSIWGYPLLLSACLFLLLSDLLGFGILGNVSLMLMVPGLVLLLLGAEYARRLWFPMAFLLFMIPIPASITQSFALRIKLLATEGAVDLARAVGLSVVRDGSYILFKNDQLLVGEVCGGLRSLIALLALGALVSYFARGSRWARGLLFVLSAPVAVGANIVRIFFLCVVAYFAGSASATGFVHDVSGFFIFVVALMAMLLLERLLVREKAAAPKGLEQ
jgi:exosortase